MGQQIIRQLNGKLCIFDSSEGTLILWDADEADILEYRAEEAAKEARRQTQRQLDDVCRGNPRHVYGSRAMTWNQALVQDQEHDGEFTKTYRTGKPQ